MPDGSWGSALMTEAILATLGRIGDRDCGGDAQTLPDVCGTGAEVAATDKRLRTARPLLRICEEGREFGSCERDFPAIQNELSPEV